MTDLRAIDAEELVGQLSLISEVLEDADLSDEQEQRADDAMSEINGLIQGFDQPVTIRDRNDTINVIVEK
ncbi:hypothetical protein EXE44_05145 [Halorubrum sp. SS7]|uniref:hypothetical protein n=1 Tax=Halorubrum sp. SS7 TaxID=2518119 RepID=UPI0010F8BF31|nr:hypothetical protein [Halorubrum sp. SS7]TKX58934.1 hypothetical protein EXE44_05145 [Halorubrum sp. SS7]